MGAKCGGKILNSGAGVDKGGWPNVRRAEMYAEPKCTARPCTVYSIGHGVGMRETVVLLLVLLLRPVL